VEVFHRLYPIVGRLSVGGNYLVRFDCRRKRVLASVSTLIHNLWNPNIKKTDERDRRLGDCSGMISKETKRAPDAELVSV